MDTKQNPASQPAAQLAKTLSEKSAETLLDLAEEAAQSRDGGRAWGDLVHAGSLSALERRGLVVFISGQRRPWAITPKGWQTVAILRARAL